MICCCQVTQHFKAEVLAVEGVCVRLRHVQEDHERRENEIHSALDDAHCVARGLLGGAGRTFQKGGRLALFVINSGEEHTRARTHGNVTL